MRKIINVTPNRRKFSEKIRTFYTRSCFEHALEKPDLAAAKTQFNKLLPFFSETDAVRYVFRTNIDSNIPLAFQVLDAKNRMDYFQLALAKCHPEKIPALLSTLSKAEQNTSVLSSIISKCPPHKYAALYENVEDKRLIVELLCSNMLPDLLATNDSENIQTCMSIVIDYYGQSNDQSSISAVFPRDAFNTWLKGSLFKSASQAIQYARETFNESESCDINVFIKDPMDMFKKYGDLLCLSAQILTIIPDSAVLPGLKELMPILLIHITKKVSDNGPILSNLCIKSLLEAMGACAAKDPNFRFFGHDEFNIRPDIRCGRESLSLPDLMRIIINDGQSYTPYIRQAAFDAIKQYNTIVKDEALEGQIATYNARFRDDMDLRNFVVYARKGSTVGELAHHIYKAVDWLSGGNTASEKIYATINAVVSHHPGVVEFFNKYPLQIMPKDDHQSNLANYLSSGYQIQRWTVYTPISRRIDDLGPVQYRYLQIVDRTTPNSMGLAYSLFSNPFLVRSALFHEYKHFEGTGNEAYARLQQSIYNRFIIAKNAPEDDHDLLAYHQQAISGFPIEDVLYLEYDLETDIQSVIKGINMMTMLTYGHNKDEGEARKIARDAIDRSNIETEYINNTEQWDPQIKHPFLSREDAKKLTNIIIAKHTQRNDINEQEYADLIKTDEIQQQLAAWKAYKNRLNRAQNIEQENTNQAVTESLSQYIEDLSRATEAQFLRLANLFRII